MLFCIWVVVIVFVVVVVVIGVGYVLSVGVVELVLDKVKVMVQKVLGLNVEIKSVIKLLLVGLYEINFGSQVVYSDVIGCYVFNGDLLDMQIVINFM